MVDGHTCDGPVSLIINDANPLDISGDILGESPTIDAGIPVSGDGLVLYERKDGPLSLSRRVEVDFPMQAFGENWFEYIEAYEEDGGIQEAEVRMKPIDLVTDDTLPPEILGEDIERDTNVEFETEITVFRGYIGSVGGNGSNTGHLTLFGPYNLLKSIPVGTTFTVGPQTFRAILQWIVDRFNGAQDIIEDIDYNIVGAEEDEEVRLLRVQGTNSSKSFSANRDTLVDIVKWIQDFFGVRMWFEPDEDGITLQVERMEDVSLYDSPVGAAPDSQETFQDMIKASRLGRPVFDATHGGDVDIIYNNALYEMKPYNAITLRGRENAEVESSGLGPRGMVPAPTGNYPEATAYYPPLVERAGGRITMTRESDKDTQQSLAETARNQLKNALDGVSGGTITLPLSPFISPYHRITAQPACAGKFDVYLPELQYEVQRTAHKITPNNEENHIPQTELSVSMSVDPSKIKTETTLKSTTPSEGGENKPKESDWFENFLSYDIVQ